MTTKKRQTLQKILEALIPYRDMAEWFLLILQEEWNEKLIEKLYQEILSEIRKINSENQQKNIETALQNLREKSGLITKADEDEAEQILNDFIDNI